MEADEVKVIVAKQGAAVVSQKGYMVIRGENVIAFYLDAWGNTGRAYPSGSASSTWVDKETGNYPCIWIDDGNEDGEQTVIAFPDFEGWNVHSSGGGKTLSICLTKRERHGWYRINNPIKENYNS